MCSVFVGDILLCVFGYEVGRVCWMSLRLFSSTPALRCRDKRRIYPLNVSKEIMLATRNSIDARKHAVCCVARNNLLMINDHLFETFRGWFNWNKLMRISVYIIGYSHVCVSRCKVQGM